MHWRQKKTQRSRTRSDRHQILLGKDAKALVDQGLARAADAENPTSEGAETQLDKAWRTMYDEEVPVGEIKKIHAPRTLEDGFGGKGGRFRGWIYGLKEPLKKVKKRQPPIRDPKRDSKKDDKRKRDSCKRK